MKYTAVLFDLDGTLLDTLEDLGDAVNRTLARHSLPLRTMQEYRYFVGDGARNLIIRALPENRRDDATVDKLLAEYRADYTVNWHVKTRPYDGVAELIPALRAKELKLAVLSNKPDPDTQKCVTEILPGCRFDIVRGALEGVPLKPDPAAAIEIARELAIAPSQFLYVGDTNTDMETAIAAGMHPVGALWGFRTREELEKAGAKTIIAHPMDLLRLIE